MGTDCIVKGGQRFAASKTTLLSLEGSFFHAMLASGRWKPDADGVYVKPFLFTNINHALSGTL